MVFPEFTKELTASYLKGAGLTLPFGVFAACFRPGDTPCTLRSADGRVDVHGNVKMKLRDEHRAGRIDITGGWRKFVNSAGLRLGDTIKLQHLPGSVLLVTVLGRAACDQQALAGLAAPACAERGAKASTRVGSGLQQDPLQKQGKRVCDVSPEVQEGARSAEASGAHGLQPTMQWQVQQRVSQQAQQQEQQEYQQADGPPGLQQDEPPYIRHTPSTTGDEQRQQQQQWEKLLGPQPMLAEEDEVAELTKQTVHAVTALCGGGSGNEQGDREGSAAARPAKRRRGIPSGLAAAAAAVAPSVTPSPKLQSGADAAEQEDDELAARAAAIVGRDVVLRNPPGTKLRWTLGQVLGTLPNQPGGLKLGPLPPLAGAQQAPPLPPPQAHVSEVAAVLPEDLVGWTVLKWFDDDEEPSKSRYFWGRVESVDEEEEPPWYHVTYQDGDGEDLEIQELLRWLQAPPGKQAACGRRRGRPPKQAGGPYNQATGGLSRQATLTGGRRLRQAPPRTASSPALGAGLAPLALEPQAVAAAQEEGGFYAAGGAGHERGATAYDRESNMLRPVGQWIADPKRGTLLGRRQKMDLRHLPDRQPLETGRSHYVPGWLGVRVAEDTQWIPGYDGPYEIAFYDTNAAVLVRVRSHSFDTVEEAARLYDKVALSYYGDTADTNYPLTDELRQELGPQEEGGSKAVITLAARLLDLEQSIPDAAIATGVGAEAWAEWENGILEQHMCRRPTATAPAALAAKLKWLMQQVHTAAILPAYRGDRLHAFLAACDECAEAGTTKEHHAAEAAHCLVCAENNKSGDSKHFKHGSIKLAALIREAETSIFSQDALEAFREEGDPDEAEAAAAEEQRDLDAKLRHWQAVRVAPEEQEPAAGNGAAAGPGVRGTRATLMADNDAVPPRRRLKVIVIGSGVAGLKAASDLQRAGAEVTVLEARDRLGGRIHTCELGSGGMTRQVDLGATFICGTNREPPVNPLLPLAVDQLGLQLRPKKRDGPDATVMYDSQGQRVPDEVLLAAEEKYGSLLEELLSRGEQCSSWAVTVGETVRDILSGMQLSEVERDIVEAYCCDLYVTTLEGMSLKGMVSTGFSGPHELVAGGFKQVVDALVQGRSVPGAPPCPLRDVRTGSVVRAVRLLRGGVGVEVVTDTQTLSAHAVVCTLPLGCLQRGGVAFDPPLPEYKMEAIHGLGMGTENRVAMLFDQVFWPEGQHFLRPVKGRYTFANLHGLGVGNVLCAWVRPAEMAAFEGMSNEQVMADVEHSLKQLFPESYRPPLSFVVTRWSQDPFCYGAYSYVPPNGRKVYYDWLSHPGKLPAP
ncbi:hypothetical protein ABPG77_009944 [Micractinium sp. CCAP 211/92]